MADKKMYQGTGGDVKPLPNNFSASLSSNAKKQAPKIGPYTPQTSQGNNRGQDKG
jgi:hypothetical protein